MTRKTTTKKVTTPFFFCFFVAFLLFVSPVYAKGRRSTGITLDCARRYYSVKELKKYIDLLSSVKDSFLQLHLTDDENVGIECETLSQTVATAVRKKGRYYNPKTEKPFLSHREIRSLLRYAEKKKVDIVPEIDLPAHAAGFLRLLSEKGGRDYAKNLASYFHEEGAFDIENPEALTLIRSLYDEYGKLFKDCSTFHIGCDEVFQDNPDKILSYINETAAFMTEKGFRVRIWNDLVTKENLSELAPHIQIAYWSFDGDTEDSEEKEERRLMRASLPELQKAGRKVLNYNSYYLYYVPSKENSDKESLRYMIKDLKKHWEPGKWDGESNELANKKNIIGASVSVWGEDSSGVKGSLIFKQTKALFQALFEKNRKK